MDTVEPINEPRPFHPGRGHKHLPSEVNIDGFRPETIAFAAIAGNWRAVEFIHGDDGIPQFLPKADETHIKCVTCGEKKPLNAFPKDTRKRNGLDSRCRRCEAARVKTYRLRHASWFGETGERNRTVNLQKTG